VYRLLFDPDPSVREHAAFEWCLWESAIPEWPPSTTLQPRFRDSTYALGFARIVTHYVRNHAWLEDEVLLDGLAKLTGTPVICIDGRHDPQTTQTAEEMVRRLSHIRHVIVENASHDASNVNLTAEIARATDQLASS
jgi:proline iminopeptidase